MNIYVYIHVYMYILVFVYTYLPFEPLCFYMYTQSSILLPHSAHDREVGGWGRVPFSRNLMNPTPRRKWYLTTGRRAH